MLSDGWSDPKCSVCVERQRVEMARMRQRIASAARSLTGPEDPTAARLRSASVPPRFAGKGFDSFSTQTEEEQTALAECVTYAEGFADALEVGRCMILCGKPGTGKTHLSCAIASKVASDGYSARYLGFAKAIRSVKQTYAKGSTLTEQQAYDALCRPDLLVLDEIGVQFGSEAEKMIGFEIINARYEAMKPTIIVSNLDERELTQVLGERVIDRLCENQGTIVILDGDSRR